jgi:hypothetical protein
MAINKHAAFALLSKSDRASPASRRGPVALDDPVLQDGEQSKNNPLVLQARRSWITPTASGAKVLVLDIAGAGKIECVLSLPVMEELRRCLEDMRTGA